MTDCMLYQSWTPIQLAENIGVSATEVKELSKMLFGEVKPVMNWNESQTISNYITRKRAKIALERVQSRLSGTR